MNSQQNKIEDMKGDVIKKIFANAEEVAGLHAALTSPRGDYFKKRLLAKLAEPLPEREVMAYAEEAGIREYKRHIHKLIAFELVEQKSETTTGGYIYRRTYDGEEALNAMRQLEGTFGPERIRPLYEASLGKNSIRLFLKVYGSSKEPTNGDIIYSPLEIGQIANFLPRTIEGISAIDKLDDAGLVSYLDDGNIHVNPKRSTAFYRYLKNIYQLIEQNDDKKNKRSEN